MNNMKNDKKGEDAALEYLLKNGYAYRERNFRAARCEIDLIVMDCDTVVFVEVKSRHGSSYGLGREAVTFAKQKHIIRAAELYLIKAGLTDSFARFDVVEVDLDAMNIVHFKDAFRPD